ncbi:CDGSH iron sulfur domain-containing protein-like protein, partial [Leptotrombidium deliense]
SNRYVAILPWITSFVAVGAAIYFYKFKNKDGSQINESISKDQSKIVHTFDIEELDKKTAYCRCWRSKKFPYCDGTHAKHNEETGDNVGPLILQKRSQ